MHPKAHHEYPDSFDEYMFYTGSFISHLMKKLSPYDIVRRAVDLNDTGSGIVCSGINDRREVLFGHEGGRVFTLSAGKAAEPMFLAIRDFLDMSGKKQWSSHIILSPYDNDRKIEDAVFIKGHHPFPDPSDVSNAKLIRKILSGAGPGDIVIVLLSGGSSSLLFSPRPGIEPEFKIDVIRHLMLSGADIFDLNTVRTFLSDVKGGGMLSSINGAEMLSIIISDVIGNDPDIIGSGPTSPWSPSRNEVLEVLNRYGIDRSVIERISKLDERAVPVHNGSVHNVVIADNRYALRIASEILSDLGYRSIIDPEPYSGEARSTSIELIRKGRGHAIGRNSAFIAGGETVVHVKGGGKGGRNLEMALSGVEEIGKGEQAIFLSTDGKDGTSAFAGAMIRYDMDHVEDARRCLDRNDSASFFERHPGGIMTGPTYANLGDLFILLSHH